MTDQPAIAVKYRIDCHCPTVAFVVESAVELYIAGAMGRIALNIPIADFDRIAQTCVLERFALLFQEFNDNTARQVEAGQLHLRGFIKYRGVGLRDDQGPYSTTFHHRWMYGPKNHLLFGEMGDHWEPCGPPEDNQQT